MPEETKSFDKYVISSVLANNEFGINEVNDIESLNSRYFLKDEYSEIERLIKDGNIAAIKLLPKNESEIGEFLDVMIFRDQNMKPYMVTVYDSDEIWQNPQVVEIYTLDTEPSLD